MKNFKNKKTLQIVLLVVIAVVTLGIGYAAISAVNLIINGNATASVDQNNFKVHFTQAQAIAGSTGVSGTSTIDSQDDTKATFDVTGLTKVGDYAEAIYTVRNDSNGIGAEIALNLSSSNTEYFKVTETIQDNKLQAGEETTAKVRVEMIKTPITDVVSTTITATLTASPLEDAQASGGSSASKVAGEPESFATDSWATIQKAVQNNNTSAYNVGDTKEVTINGTDYTVRIANKSTSEQCNNQDYSETACGFVVEFTDIITEMAMHDTNTNIGGYPGTDVYAYLRDTLYNQLPSDLQVAILKTKVISGYACNEYDYKNGSYPNYPCLNPDNNGNNFVTYDKLYILTPEEVFGNFDISNSDTSLSKSSQLDYYANLGRESFHCNHCGPTGGLDLSGQLGTQKKYLNSYNESWWLRSTSSFTGSISFGIVVSNIDEESESTGRYGSKYPTGICGVAPAFRIG